MIEQLGSKDELRAAVAEARRESKTVGFVPTMGALHEGHLSLVRAARSRADLVVVSIFVNPTQFAPGEDFERYPRRLDEDMALLAAEGAEIVFTPSAETMYEAGATVTVDPGPLGDVLEGAARPGHFRGVATVVAKLLGIVRSDVAFFGEKDFQQLRIVERLARDLDIGTQIVGCPIVRDADGLALSSRNAYLGPAERAAALAIPEALEAAAQAAAWGETDGRAIEAAMREVLDAAGLEVGYAVLVDPATLRPVEAFEAPARALIAAKVGGVRLIDNCEIRPGRVPAHD